MAETSFSEIVAKFWEEHPQPDGWSIETAFLQRANNANLAFKATIKQSGRVIVTAHTEGGTSIERAEEKAITKAIEMLPPPSNPTTYKLNWGPSSEDS